MESDIFLYCPGYIFHKYFTTGIWKVTYLSKFCYSAGPTGHFYFNCQALTQVGRRPDTDAQSTQLCISEIEAQTLQSNNFGILMNSS